MPLTDEHLARSEVSGTQEFNAQGETLARQCNRSEAALYANAADKSRPTSTKTVGNLMPGRCHMGNCSWFKIEERRLAGNGSNGDLYKISARAWELPYSDPAPLEGGKLLTYYVFCSMVRPAVMFQTSKGDRWFVHTLAPGKDDGVFGYNEDDYKIYFSVCHNVVINNVHDDSADLGRKLGYNINSESVDQTEIQRPEDIFDYDLKAKGVK